jgi:hypothetical protein
MPHNDLDNVPGWVTALIAAAIVAIIVAVCVR